MLTFRVLVLWIHLLAVVIWIGGMFFNALIVMPALRKSLSSPKNFARSFENITRRFNTFSKEMIGVIVLTGIFNLINAGWGIQYDFSAHYLNLLFIKLFLVVIIILLQMIHSRVFVPKLIERLSQQNAANAPADLRKLRRRSFAITALTLLTAAVIILLGVMLGRG